MPNHTIYYATCLVDELARAGLQYVCLAPGSRNTPLVLACAQHPALRVSSHLDERSAAFFALGIALATDTPAAVICTSGSAAANFLPAIVEAHQSAVPLLILTADRPPELRHSGANQTIDQVKLFGDVVLWSIDAPLPEAVPPALLTRSIRTLAARALARAGGRRKGVVHINLPFRPPLEPTPLEGDQTEPGADAQPRPDLRPYTQMMTASADHLPMADVQALAELVNQYERGLIVCGPRCPPGASGEFGALAAALSERAGYPLLVDGVSGLRFGTPGVLGGYETFLSGAHPFAAPHLVIRFGAVPTSKMLHQYLDNAAPPVHIHVRSNGLWADDSHRTSHSIQADEAAFIRALLPYIVPRQSKWQRTFAQVESLTWQTIEAELDKAPYFDGAAVSDTLDLLPAGAALFVGNSLAVRHLDQFGRPTARPIRTYANRGASGIDGNLSTALGVGAACPGMPLVAIVGDITFYHDMNGLLAVQRCGVPITIVLLSNDGGGIFHRLPISRFEPQFTPYFVTPHGLDFAHAARLYGLDFVRVEEREPFRRAVSECVASQRATLIEVRTDARHDLERWQACNTLVQTVLHQHMTTMAERPQKEQEEPS
jgi:2-succinyl-5-enolpyruvyl-6-hydroxy-3-cyclohexene-1-carboxylate synthase